MLLNSWSGPTACARFEEAGGIEARARKPASPILAMLQVRGQSRTGRRIWIAQSIFGSSQGKEDRRKWRCCRTIQRRKSSRLDCAIQTETTARQIRPALRTSCFFKSSAKGARLRLADAPCAFPCQSTIARNGGARSGRVKRLPFGKQGRAGGHGGKGICSGLQLKLAGLAFNAFPGSN